MNDSNRISLLDVKGKYDHKEWSQWRRSNYAYFAEKLLGLSKTQRLVDLGAGSVPFKDLFRVFVYTGVDCVPFKDVSIIADFEKNIPIADGLADIITLSNVIEHVSHSLVLLKECHRVLSPNGRIIGTVPFLMKAHQVPYDFNRYTSYQIRKILEEAGFRQIEVVPLGKLVDAYDTIELKFFSLANTESLFLSCILRVIRIIRRAEMRLIRLLFQRILAHEEYTEGYGFYAIR